MPYDRVHVHSPNFARQRSNTCSFRGPCTITMQNVKDALRGTHIKIPANRLKAQVQFPDELITLSFKFIYH